MRTTNTKTSLARCGRKLTCAALVLHPLFATLQPVEAAGKLSAKQRAPQVQRVQYIGDTDRAAAIEAAAGQEDSNPVTSAFKRAGESIQGLFTSSPREVKAPDDPVSLSNMPEEVGPSVYLTAARMMENAGNFQGAERQYKKCLAEHPKHRLARISYARLLNRSDRLEESLGEYRKALENHPGDAVILNDLGLCLARLGQHEEAMQRFHQATLKAPEDPRYRNNLAMVLVDAGRLDEALSQLTFAHGEAQGHFNLGYLLHRKGNVAAAAENFQIALQIDPSLKPAQEMLHRIQGTGAGDPQIAQPNRIPPAPRTMFISDQPQVKNQSVAPANKMPPAPELEPPRLLPPVR